MYNKYIFSEKNRRMCGGNTHSAKCSEQILAIESSPCTAPPDEYIGLYIYMNSH